MARPGKKVIFVELPEKLAAQLDKLRARTRRTITAEVSLALEAWLKQHRAPRTPGK